MPTTRLLSLLALLTTLAVALGAPVPAGARTAPAHAHHARRAKTKHKVHKRHKKVRHARRQAKPLQQPTRIAPAVGAPAPALQPTPTTGSASVTVPDPGQFAGTAIDEEPAGDGYGGLPYADGNCTRYAWTRRQDLPATLGNATTWDERAAAAGFPVDGTPQAGDIGVMEAGTHGTGAYGHVFYVERVNADGTIFISEMNWAGFNVVSSRTISAAGIRFIHHKGAVSPPSQPAPPTTFTHHVVGTCAEGACGLRKRTGPGWSAYGAVGTVYDGQEVAVVCQTLGEAVAGRNATSAVWDRLTDGTYVSDYYLDTPAVGTWSAPIPRC